MRESEREEPALCAVCKEFIGYKVVHIIDGRPESIRIDYRHSDNWGGDTGGNCYCDVCWPAVAARLCAGEPPVTVPEESPTSQ